MTPMPTPASDIAFTTAVKAAQTARGSRSVYERHAREKDFGTTVTNALADFLETADMFYLGTASAAGRPYIQYRGGPPGFLHVLDDRTLAFADFAGNRQYISTGNLSENPQAFLFLMDYQQRRRFKLWGRARVEEDEWELLERLADPAYEAKPERAVVFTLEAWDANCPQHIHRRLPEAGVAALVAPLKARIRELEQLLGEER